MSHEPVYANDHSQRVLDRHRWRNISNSASFIIDYLKPGMEVLDVGCGPGSLTVDIAKRVGPTGRVTGIENVPDPLNDARELAQKEGVNVEFQVADGLKLPFPDDSFDMVFAHQVLQHVAEPIQMLSEMRRVARSQGGIVACRESAMPLWYPESKGFSLGMDVFTRMTEGRGGNPHPGGRIHVWARQAGFERSQIKYTTATWTFSSPEERSFWGGSFSKQGTRSQNAIKGGYATAEQLNEVEKAWHDFIEDDDAWYTILHGEIICVK